MLIEEISEQIRIMFDPESMKRKGIKNAFLYYYKISIIPIVIGVVLGLLGVAFFSLLSNGISGAFGGTSAHLSLGGPFAIFVILGGASLLLIWIIEPIAIIVSAALLQLIGGNLLGIFKGSYEDTITASVYSSSTMILFSWIMIIPVIGWIISCVISIWAFVIEVLGLAKLHKTGAWKVFGTMILTCIIVGVILFLIVLLVILPLIVASGLGGTFAHFARFPVANKTV